MNEGDHGLDEEGDGHRGDTITELPPKKNQPVLPVVSKMTVTFDFKNGQKCSRALRALKEFEG